VVVGDVIERAKGCAKRALSVIRNVGHGGCDCGRLVQTTGFRIFFDLRPATANCQLPTANGQRWNWNAHSLSLSFASKDEPIQAYTNIGEMGETASADNEPR